MQIYLDTAFLMYSKLIKNCMYSTISQILSLITALYLPFISKIFIDILPQTAQTKIRLLLKVKGYILKERNMLFFTSFSMGTTLEGKNLLLWEQILSDKSRH